MKKDRKAEKKVKNTKCNKGVEDRGIANEISIANQIEIAIRDQSSEFR